MLTGALALRLADVSHLENMSAAPVATVEMARLGAPLRRLGLESQFLQFLEPFLPPGAAQLPRLQVTGAALSPGLVFDSCDDRADWALEDVRIAPLHAAEEELSWDF